MMLPHCNVLRVLKNPTKPQEHHVQQQQQQSTHETRLLVARFLTNRPAYSWARRDPDIVAPLPPFVQEKRSPGDSAAPPYTFIPAPLTSFHMPHPLANPEQGKSSPSNPKFVENGPAYESKRTSTVESCTSRPSTGTHETGAGAVNALDAVDNMDDMDDVLANQAIIQLIAAGDDTEPWPKSVMGAGPQSPACSLPAAIMAVITDCCPTIDPATRLGDRNGGASNVEERGDSGEHVRVGRPDLECGEIVVGQKEIEHHQEADLEAILCWEAREAPVSSHAILISPLTFHESI
ncbi:hypothetical protein BCR44DRAFT_33812 [Catenaria anguillulae PL171]|uniref:Uncharacterized protein n=1 Tax=Catenaria anguillulae PL171 TaxID=765915 RepID=A0A1Y2HN05_9FUNG|nr:hypothetical protein BCR44DRAFT_33812 [Catenaria anguillulae PL171]